MILNLSILFSFLRLFSIFADVLKVAKTLTFETSLISLSMVLKFDNFEIKLNLDNSQTALKLAKLSSFKTKINTW